MQIDKAKRLARASALHQQTLNAMPMQDAVMHLALLVAEREQERDHWKHLAEECTKQRG